MIAALISSASVSTLVSSAEELRHLRTWTASSSRSWLNSQRGDSGMKKSMRLTIIAIIACKAKGNLHEKLLLYRLVPYSAQYAINYATVSVPIRSHCRGKDTTWPSSTNDREEQTIVPRIDAGDVSACHTGTLLVIKPIPMPATIRPTIN